MVRASGIASSTQAAATRKASEKESRDAWADPSAYEASAKKLAGLFTENFKKYESGVEAEVKAASPAA